MNTQEMIKVMQAYVGGEEIQYNMAGRWHTATKPNWDWAQIKYRVKPRTYWVNINSDRHGLTYHTRDKADRASSSDRIAYIQFTEGEGL